MARDSIIMGRNITEDGVGREPFSETMNIGSREVRLHVSLTRKLFLGMIVLSGVLNNILDSINGSPTQIGA